MRNRISTNHKLIITWVIISIWGLAFIYSASYRLNTYQNIAPYQTVILPIVIFILMILVLISVYRFKTGWYRTLKNTAKLQFYFAFASLVIVFVISFVAPVLGMEKFFTRGNAYQVIPLGITDYQPLEYFKIAAILYFAALVGKEGRKRSLNELYLPVGAIGVGSVFIAIQPDTGGAFIMALITALLILINGAHVSKILRWGAVAVLVLGLIISIGSSLALNSSNDSDDHRVSRIESFIDPFADPEDSGLNIINSTLAISNGGLTGVGYLNSTQSSGYLFAGYSDFIYAVIAEETGLFGTLFTILLLIYISRLSFVVARSAHNRFGELYCYGFGTLILVQTSINIGGVVGVIPMTGVTLPFISNGINSFVFMTLGLFYVVIIDIEAKRRNMIQKKREEELFL